MFRLFKKYCTAAVFLLVAQLLLMSSAGAQIYTNDFEGGGIDGTTSFTGGATGDPNLGIAASAWSTDGLFTIFTGAAPTATTSMALQPGTASTTTWTLSVPVNAGYSANITSLDLDYRSTSTSYNFLTISINGTTVYASSVLTDASFHHISLTGLTVPPITGAISVVSVMSGGSHGSASTFRYDNVIVDGTVVPANHAPSFTGGPTQVLSVCQNSATSIDALMPVSDIDMGQTETWSVATAPAHGALGGFNTTSVATGGVVTPAGLTYTPAPGYSGVDVFTIRVSDGVAVATTTVNVTVLPAPPSITGITNFCQGSATSLSNSLAGGTWSSADPSVANADMFTGVVSGVSAGTVNVTYTNGTTGCTVVSPVTVVSGPDAITGANGVCAGATITLNNAVAGGAWASSNTAVATISGSGMVYGLSSGTTTISYTVGACAVGMNVTVNTLAPIAGNTHICAGTTTLLNCATPGGVWSSANPLAATVSPSGMVTGVVSGSAAIYYAIGACYVSVLVSVGYPIGPVTGADSVCGGASVVLQNVTPGGVWSTSNTTIAVVNGGGGVAGISQGVVTVSYTVGSCTEVHDIYVKAGNAGIIVGKDSLCKGPGHQLTLSNAIAGGVWSSTNTARATVDPVTGVVMGVNTGVDTIKYTVINTCGKFVVKKWIYIRTPYRCATGADDVADEVLTELKAFPNPNYGVFTINLVSALNEDVHVVVHNIVGAQVYELATTTNKPVEIHINVPPGIYLVSAVTAEGRYMAKVIVN